MNQDEKEEKGLAGDALFRMMVENAPDGIFVQTQNRFAYANPAAQKLFGAHSSESLIGMNVFERFDPRYHSLIQQRIQTLVGNRQSVPAIEEVFYRLDGSSLDVEVSAVPIQWEGKQGALVFFREISERKRIQQESNQRHAMLRAILDSSEASIYSLDRDYCYTSFNQAHASGMRSLYGAEIELGKCMLDYQIVEEDRRQLLQHLERALRGETLTLEGYFGEEGQERRYFQMRYHPIQAEGETIGVSVFVNDLTAHKNAEDALQRYSTRLEQEVEQRTQQLVTAQEKLVRQERLAVLGQLSGSIGHELRNPLGVISNAVYFLRMIQPDASAKVIEYLEIINSETRRAEKIINDLLDFSRIKSIDREPVAVADTVEQMLQRYPPPDNITVRIRREAGLPMILVDPNHLIQVLGNLALNAYQAMPEGGELMIEAKQHTEGIKRYIAIALKDSGGGIPPENLAKLFEPLFTTKAKGIGLGLPVCQKLLEANDGRIEVQSEPGKGSTFTIHLPVYRKAI